MTDGRTVAADPRSNRLRAAITAGCAVAVIGAAMAACSEQGHGENLGTHAASKPSASNTPATPAERNSPSPSATSANATPGTTRKDTTTPASTTAETAHVGSNTDRGAAADTHNAEAGPSPNAQEGLNEYPGPRPQVSGPPQRIPPSQLLSTAHITGTPAP